MAVIKDKTQEWRALHGRHVRIFYFINREDGVCPYVDNSGKELVLHCEPMGDRIEMWICWLDLQGREQGRYNTKAVESIVWMEAA